MENIRIRNAEPSDYPPIISVINEWWGGRNMADMLPKLFSFTFDKQVLWQVTVTALQAF